MSGSVGLLAKAMEGWAIHAEILGGDQPKVQN